jgi:hypothetical protein
LSCGLEEFELYILDELFSHRCFSDKGSCNLLRFAKAYQRIFKLEIVEVAKDLSSKGYITQKKKSDPKYWISDYGKVYFALESHGYDVVSGRIRRL